MDRLKLLRNLSKIVERIGAGMRIGSFSRAPLHILRVELTTTTRRVCCDWLIRPVDRWDESQPPAERAKIQMQQVFEDALAMRKLIFRLFPNIETTELCAYRDTHGGIHGGTHGGTHELVLAGTMQRGDDVPDSIASLAMRAHLSGFHFIQVDGALSALPLDRVRSSAEVRSGTAR